MIKKETILKTVVTHWSAEDESFVAVSPLFSRVIGTGDTVTEAVRTHEEMLDRMYEHLVNDKVVGYKTGRPAKPGIALNCKVKDDTHESIKRIADEFGLSQGEVVDLAIYFYAVRVSQKPATPTDALVLKRLDRIESRLKAAEQQSVRGRGVATRPKVSKAAGRPRRRAD